MSETCRHRKRDVHVRWKTPYTKRRVIHKGKHKKGFYEKHGKRILDVVLSGTALVALSPLMLFLAARVRYELGNPVIFKQRRPGKDEKIFEMYKFRSMIDARDSDGNLLPDEERLTDFGKRIRASSMDELPELVNVLKGDMSLVGPRPLLVQYLDRYSEWQRRRHDVRPGLTGYAQAHGRNELSWEEKFKMDVWYVGNVSFKVDVAILIDTIRIIWKHEGIHSDISATMEEFIGNKEKQDEE